MRQTVVVTLGVLLALAALLVAAVAGGLVGFVIGGALAGRNGPDIPERRISGEGPDKIAVIRVVGAIAREGEGVAPFVGVGASSRHIVEQLDQAERDAAVRAVILEMDTPGGSVVASDEIHEKVQALRRARKVVVSLMTETAASGGYYVAAGTDHIVASPTTITGSIGVIVALVNVQDLNRKIGLRTLVFKSGAFKDLGNPDRPLQPQEAAIFQRLVNEAYGRFVDVVAQGRRMERARVLRIADGRIYTGAQALRLGLVDSLGHRPTAIAVAEKRAGLKNALVVEYGGDGLLRVLLGSTRQRLRVWMGQTADPGATVHQPFRVQYIMAP